MSLTNLIFLNLPVLDTVTSTAFYEAIGAEKNPMFSDETTSCMVLSDTIHVMLLNHDRFAGFTPGLTIADATSTTGMLIAISQGSAANVDAIVARAVAAGGSADPTPKQEHGEFMYGRSFRSPDGHIWEAIWMDVAAMGAQPAEQQGEPAAA